MEHFAITVCWSKVNAKEIENITERADDRIDSLRDLLAYFQSCRGIAYKQANGCSSNRTDDSDNFVRHFDRLRELVFILRGPQIGDQVIDRHNVGISSRDGGTQKWTREDISGMDNAAEVMRACRKRLDILRNSIGDR